MAKKKAKKWIQGAISHPGALTKAAQAAGKSITEYCAQGSLTPKRQKQCNLAKTLRGMNR
jgi:hypothetical protein